MDKSERKRSSSITRKRRRSIDRRSKSASLPPVPDTIIETSETLASSNISLQEPPPPPEKPKINYQDELVLIFFNSMLDNMVEDWSVVQSEQSETSSKDVKMPKITNMDFQDLTIDDLKNNEIVSVDKSQVSLTKRRTSKKRSSLGSKNVEKSSKISLKSKRDSIKKDDELSHRKLSKQGSARKKSNDSKSRQSLKHSVGSVPNLKSATSKASNVAKSRTSLELQDIQEAAAEEELLDWILDAPEETVAITFKNGNYYEGQVSKKLMHGRGKFYWADGGIYEGEFKKGHATGVGKLTYPDLSYYSGQFCNGLLHGEGVMYITSTPMVYNGNWKAGKKHGTGWLLYEPNNWYQGEWFEDKRQGIGLRRYKDGSKYTGEWFDGTQNGQGTMIWSNRDFYKGDWLNGLMHGYGEYVWNAFCNQTFTFPLQNMYQGTWLNGMRDGAGILNFGFDGGARMAGVWENNCKHGAGVVICGNGKLIERNPLFWHDKPVHLEDCTSKNVSEMPKEETEREDSDTKINDTVKSSLQLIAQQVYSKRPSKRLEPEIIENIEKNETRETWKFLKSRADFPTYDIHCNPLEIPIHSVAEQIDLSYYVDEFIEKYSNMVFSQYGSIQLSKDFPEPRDTTTESVKFNILTMASAETSRIAKNYNRENSVNESKCETYSVFLSQLEEKYLRHAIIVNLSKIQNLYYDYATTTSEMALNFIPILTRLFFWHFCLDVEIPNHGLSLIDIDLLLADNPTCGLETVHYPFEKIYFWQFLQALIALSWTIYSGEENLKSIKGDGILSKIFIKFLNEDVLPKAGGTISLVLHEYKNMLPIQSVYSLYKSFGEPHSARQFLNNVCVKKGKQPPCYLRDFTLEKPPAVKSGINAVPVGQNLMFFTCDGPCIGERPPEPQELSDVDPFYKELYIFRSLGPKRVVANLIKICPQIASEGVIVNMDYQLTFLEFYKLLLSCALNIVNKKKKRVYELKFQEKLRQFYELLEQQQLEEEALAAAAKSVTVVSSKVGKKASKDKKSKAKTR